MRATGILTRIWFSMALISPSLIPNSFAVGSVRYDVDQTQHPRLFFSSEDIPSLRIQAQTTHREIWLPILDFVDTKLASSPPAAPVCPDLDSFRHSGNQLITFAFAYVITGERDYFELTRRYLLGYTEWEIWGDESECGDRDLGFHHMLLGNVMAYDWVFNDLSDEDRAVIGAHLAQRAQESYEASTSDGYQWGNWWRRSYVQNHHWTAHSTLGMAALVLEGEDPRAQLWLDHTVDQMEIAQYILEGIADGSWHEGIPYQSYGLTMSLPFFYNLRRLKGKDIIPHTYLRNYTYWRIYNSLPNSYEFALSYGDFEWDWGNTYKSQNILRFIAREYQDGHAEWMADQLVRIDGRRPDIWWAPWYVFEFLYYDPGIDMKPPDDLPNIRTFQDMEGVIWRAGWGENDLVFALKTGAYGGRNPFDRFTNGDYPFVNLGLDEFNNGHDHADSNTFYLYRGDVDLASENVGYGESGTEYHNTILIDGMGQYEEPSVHNSYRYWDKDPDLFRGADGKLEAVYETQGFNYLVADATSRYRLTDPETGKPATQMVDEFRRYVLFVRPNYFVMIDHLRADSPHRYEWTAHFSSSVTVEGDWIKGSGEEGQILGVKVLTPDDFATSTGDDGKPYVRVRPSSDVADTNFVMVLYPTDTAEWEAKPPISSLGGNDQGSGLRVNLDGIQDHIFSLGAQGTVTIGDYALDGDVASIIMDENGQIRRMFLGQGSRLADMRGERTLIQSRNDNAVIEVRYEGSALEISGEDIVALMIYAPNIDLELISLNGHKILASRIGDYVLIGDFPDSPNIPTAIPTALPAEPTSPPEIYTSTPTPTPLPLPTTMPMKTSFSTPTPFATQTRLAQSTLSLPSTMTEIPRNTPIDSDPLHETNAAVIEEPITDDSQNEYTGDSYDREQLSAKGASSTLTIASLWEIIRGAFRQLISKIANFAEGRLTTG